MVLSYIAVSHNHSTTAIDFLCCRAVADRRCNRSRTNYDVIASRFFTTIANLAPCPTSIDRSTFQLSRGKPADTSAHMSGSLILVFTECNGTAYQLPRLRKRASIHAKIMHTKPHPTVHCALVRRPPSTASHAHPRTRQCPSIVVRQTRYVAGQLLSSSQCPGDGLYPRQRVSTYIREHWEHHRL